MHNFLYHDFIVELADQAALVDQDSSDLMKFLRMLTSNVGTKRSIKFFENSHLEKLFGASTALAFTYWQHLAASERLGGYEDWQRRCPALWKSIESNEKLCGLITTHLAQPQGAGVTAKPVKDGFHLTGKASWVCGFQIFDLAIVGFDAGAEIIFAVITFPAPSPQVAIKRLSMACLEGSSTVEISFYNFFVSDQDIASRRPELSTAPPPRPTKYVSPEIGIAKKAVNEIKQLIANSSHPRHQLIFKKISKLENRLAEFDRLRESQSSSDILGPLRDDLNHDAIRLLSLAIGASSIRSESGIPRRQNELLLFDSVIQSPASLETKIHAICEGREI